MKEVRILEILKKISSINIAVYGDFCLDAYWMMGSEGSEVSVETGIEAEAVTMHRYSPGGAGNVVANVAALKPACLKVMGVVGNDIYGRELTTQMEALGADVSMLVIQDNDFDTYTYTKRYYGEEEGARIDFGTKNTRSKESDSIILRNIRYALENFDVLIFNQQVCGSISNIEFIDEANKLFDEFRDKIVILDSRHFNDRFRNVYRKVNEFEIAAMCGIDVKPQGYISTAEVERCGRQVYKQYSKPVFVTRGDRGIMVIDRGGVAVIPGIQLMKKLDSVGAGDTTISALALCLAAGVEPSEAAVFANFAAAVTVEKLFTTGTASGEEIVRMASHTDYIYNPELAEDIRFAKCIPETEIEVCSKEVLSRLGRVKHVVFDHDGTVSTLREGWEKIMKPVMVEAILGDQYQTADKVLLDEVSKRSMEFIDITTGIQTIVQMEGLVQLVKDFGVVPYSKILDKFGYKKVYNNALMKMVDERIGKLELGQLGVNDFTVSGAVGFLKLLKREGMKLYLASGTDKDDVVNEAKRLGYAALFDGHIYGALGSIKKYSKRMVINSIIEENNLHGDELMVVGDGPVEIKECNRSGGISIGVASDEVRRFGLNTKKRTRLIKSGAHLIVPDFLQSERLLKLILSTR